MIQLLRLILSVVASCVLAVAPVLGMVMGLNHARKSLADPTVFRRTDAVAATIFALLCACLTFFVWRALFSIAMTSHRQDRGRAWIREGRCPACGFDIRVTPHQCPECGTRLLSGEIWLSRDEEDSR